METVNSESEKRKKKDAPPKWATDVIRILSYRWAATSTVAKESGMVSFRHEADSAGCFVAADSYYVKKLPLLVSSRLRYAFWWLDYSEYLSPWTLSYCLWMTYLPDPFKTPPLWGTADAENRSPLFRSQSSKVLPLPQQTPVTPPLWGTADAEIKVPSVEKPELRGYPLKAWGRSVYSHACYAYCHWSHLCQFLSSRSIRLHFSKTSPELFLCSLWLTPVPVLAPQDEIGHPARRYRRFLQVLVLSVSGI